MICSCLYDLVFIFLHLTFVKMNLKSLGIVQKKRVRRAQRTKSAAVIWAIAPALKVVRVTTWTMSGYWDVGNTVPATIFSSHVTFVRLLSIEDVQKPLTNMYCVEGKKKKKSNHKLPFIASVLLFAARKEHVQRNLRKPGAANDVGWFACESLVECAVEKTDITCEHDFLPLNCALECIKGWHLARRFPQACRPAKHLLGKEQRRWIVYKLKRC